MKILETLLCVWIGVIRGGVPGSGTLVLTSSTLTGTDGDLITLTCSFSSGFVVFVAWLHNNTTQVMTQWGNNCIKQPPPVGSNYNISRFTVSCNNTVHRIEFRYDSTRDQGEWQCGKPASDTSISARSNIFNIVVASSVISTQSSSTTNHYMRTVSEPGIMTSHKASTGDSGTDTIYIVVGTVGGAVLLAVVVVGVVCIQRRRQAVDHQNDTKEERHVEATPVYQNTTSFHTVSDSSAPVTKPEKTQDDSVVSEDVNTQNMYESLTSVEMHIYRRLK